MSAKPMTTMLAAGVVLIGGVCALAQDWPQWRGPNRDNKVTGFTAPATWPKELKQQWKVPVGAGESSPLLVGDKLYVFGRQGEDEVTLCLNASTGKEVWTDKYEAETVKGPAATIGGGFKGTRSTPAVGEGKICTLGVGGVVSCLDAATGKVAWRKDTKSKPMFYTSSSPMIADGKCIVFVGKLTAYDLASGDVKWESPAGAAPYGSPVLATLAGVKQLVTPFMGGLAGVDFADGKVLWQVKIGPGAPEYQSNFSTPIIDGQHVIYTANAKGKGGGGGSGTIALNIEKQGDEVKATEVWKKDLAAHQYHTPLLKDGLLYGTSKGLTFFCLDAKTGDTLWTDEAKHGQCGCILDAGSVLLALSSDKELIAFKASSKAYEEVVKYQVADAETWAVPIVAGNRIFVKDRGGTLTLWKLE